MSKSSKGIAGKVRRNAPARWRASLPLSPERFLPPGGTVSLADLQCSLCKCIVDGPVQTPCSLREPETHIASGCRSKRGPASYSPSKLTVGQIIARPLTSPPTLIEQKAASRIMKRMLSSSSEPSSSSASNLIELPTKGQVREKG